VDTLIVARAIHFASTAMVAGAIFFLSFVAAPALRPVVAESAAAILSQRLRMLVWLALVVSILSGFAWLLLLSARIAGQPATAAFAGGVVWTVLTETRFGTDWMVRLCIALLLAAILFFRSAEVKSKLTWRGWVVTFLAACLVGSLAWSGHAGASPGIKGGIHLVSDILHLVAVGAWVGALPPFAMLLSFALQAANHAWSNVAVVGALRFSTLGLLSVGTITATGIVNTLNLAGSLPALTGTEYGELLLFKISLFTAMVGIAAVNRLRLLPRLADANATRPLRRNVVLEIALATVIMFIVGALGTLPPGEHIHVH
jgi:putative copper resistance protein D